MDGNRHSDHVAAEGCNTIRFEKTTRSNWGRQPLMATNKMRKCQMFNVEFGAAAEYVLPLTRSVSRSKASSFRMLVGKRKFDSVTWSNKRTGVNSNERAGVAGLLGAVSCAG